MTAPHDAAAAAAIAKGLTKAQITLLCEPVGTHHFASGYKPGEKLVQLGLLDRSEDWRGTRVTLTPLGLIVRAHLQSERPTDAG